MSTHPSRPDNDLDEENIFSILSHPTRRTLLKLLYNQHGASFTTIAEELQSSTGSIYHHLNKLEDLVLQSTDKRYTLTDKGREVTEQYLNQSRTRVETIETYTQLTRRLFHLVLERYNLPILGLVLLCLLGNIAVTRIDAVLLGAVILPGTEISSVQSSWLSILYTLSLFLVYYLLVYLLKSERPGLWISSKVYVISISLANLLLIVVYLLLVVFYFSIPLWVFILMNLVSQVFFLMVVSAGTIQYQGLSIAPSMLISLVLLYLGLFLNLII